MLLLVKDEAMVDEERNSKILMDCFKKESIQMRLEKKARDAANGIVRKPRKKVPPKQNKKPKGKFNCKAKKENGEICGKLQYLFRRLDHFRYRCDDCYRKWKKEPIKVKLSDEDKKKQKDRAYKCRECKLEKRKQWNQDLNKEGTGLCNACNDKEKKQFKC